MTVWVGTEGLTVIPTEVGISNDKRVIIKYSQLFNPSDFFEISSRFAFKKLIGKGIWE